ncbi:pumilio homolog 3-like [Ornithodoros turicata]|uniref:pumilio homolog 3-like n=1 Tax=Ornithodoros turicata TaxID=34597 RepID=UPI003139CF59
MPADETAGQVLTIKKKKQLKRKSGETPGVSKYDKNSKKQKFPSSAGKAKGPVSYKQLEKKKSSPPPAPKDASVATAKKAVKRKAEDSSIESSEKELLHMSKKQRKIVRKMQGGNYEISKEVKLIWEDLRRRKCLPDTRQELLKKMENIIKGRVKQLIFAHDTSRAIECFESYGSEQQRSMLFDEVKDIVVPMCKSTYAKFIVLKMLMKGTKKQRENVIKAFNTHIVSLMNHSEAGSIIEYYYNEHANAVQRSQLLQEFYSRDFALFKEDKVVTFKDVLAKSPAPAKLIEDFKETLIKMIDKPVLRHTMVHHLLYEFFKSADDASRSEVIPLLAGSLAEILHTKDGARVAMQCIFYGTAKDRKNIIKGFKTHMVKIAKDENAYLILISIFDRVDDTKLIESSVTSELLKSALELALDKHGCKVLAYLVAPRDTRMFHPDIINILKEGDATTTSKKDVNIRREQLRNIAAKELVKLIENNIPELLKVGHSAVFASVVLTTLREASTPALNKIAELLSSPYEAGEDLDREHLFDQTYGRFLLNKLIKHDKDNNEGYMSQLLVRNVPEEVMQSWTESNFGRKLLMCMKDAGSDEVKLRVGAVLSATG